MIIQKEQHNASLAYEMAIDKAAEMLATIDAVSRPSRPW